MKFHSISAALSLAAIASLTVACLGGELTPEHDTVLITADDVDAVADGQDLQVDIGQQAHFVFDSSDAPLDFSRITLTDEGASMPMETVLDILDEETAAIHQDADQLILSTVPGTRTGATDDATARMKLHCSADGKFCLQCTYDDVTGQWLLCDVYSKI